MDYLKNIENKRVDKVIAGGGNGSIILFDFIDDLEKYVLFVYCVWRLSLNNNVLTGLNDDSGVFVTELKKLENEVVINVVAKSLGDFTIEFNSGKKLDVFSDLTSNGGNDDVNENWTICNVLDNICYDFTNRFIFHKTPYGNSL